MNRHDQRSTDFKSVVSTDFTTRAECFYFGTVKEMWRRDPESNRTRWICNPEHNRFAIAPLLGGRNSSGVILKILAFSEAYPQFFKKSNSRRAQKQQDVYFLVESVNMKGEAARK